MDEELVNVPNWLPLDIAVEDGDWWSAGGLAERDERRELDLRQGLLTRTARLVAGRAGCCASSSGAWSRWTGPIWPCLETTVVPEGWSGQISIRSGIDTSRGERQRASSPG